MFGRESAGDVQIPYRDTAKESVEFRQETVVGIDPVARRVATDVGVHDADFLVVAMGADYDMAATPGFEAGGPQDYTPAGGPRPPGRPGGVGGGGGGRFGVRAAVQGPPAPVWGAV